VARHFVKFVLDNSLLLLAGTSVALVWANVDLTSYERVTNPLRFFVNDIGMVFFFALAAKEVFEAMLPGGALASRSRAIPPLAAAIGGMLLPAGIYVTLALIFRTPELLRGWAIPCATDIAFSAMIARMIFPAAHPAIPFLLLLALADDALGLVILTIFYPSGSVSLPALMVLLTAAVLFAIWLRRRQTRSFWPYVIGPGSLAWAGLYLGGIHPALTLVPIIPFMPHSSHDLGVSDLREELRPDTLSQLEHWWAVPVQFVLLLFGLVNAGVPLERIGAGTYYVLTALLVGKPVGILLFSLGTRLIGASLPRGLRISDLVIVGSVAAIGFTVSMFFAIAAFPEGPALAETKMGALLSFVAGPIAVGVSWFSARRRLQLTGVARMG
jgi:NhaA family Na+:H+ antiporter